MMSSNHLWWRVVVILTLAVWQHVLCNYIPPLFKVQQTEYEYTFQRPDTEVLTVHLVAHSHQDVGWLRTKDQYYEERVKHIYNNVLDCLIESYESNSGIDELSKRAHPLRKFIIVEQAFFQRWFKEVSREKQDWVKRFLREEILEFVNGGWVMHDEGCTTGNAVIDQMVLGQQEIYRMFPDMYEQVRPLVAFQIDPFGHSAFTPVVTQRLGLKALITNRIHVGVREQLKESGQLEFLWAPVGTRQVEVLTHNLDNHYNSPQGFDFERDSPPIEDEDTLRHYADQLVRHLRQRSLYYPSSRNFLQLVGDDFEFLNAKVQFENWDKLITYINDNYQDIQLKWSILREYFEAVAAEQLTHTRYQGDFFPYADNELSYWSGYFTSKPVLKRSVQEAELRFKSAQILQLQGTIRGRDLDKKALLQFRQSIAEVQHHDGITGTAKDFVSYSYITALIQYWQRLAQDIKKTLFEEGISSAKDTEVPLVVFNPSEIASSAVAVVEIQHCPKAHVKDGTKNEVTAQELGDGVKNFDHFSLTLYVFRHNLTDGLVAFHAQVAPFSTQQYYVDCGGRELMQLPSYHSSYWKEIAFSSNNAIIENEYLKVQLVLQDQRLALKVDDLSARRQFEVELFLHSYESYHGEGQKAGAYISRVIGQSRQLLNQYTSVYIRKGPLFQQLKIKYSNSASQILTLYSVVNESKRQVLEVKNVVGPLNQDQELVSRIKISDSSDCSLETLDQGSILVDRKLNVHHLEANMVPFVGAATFKCQQSDGTKALRSFIFNDRSMAIGHTESNAVEILLHRRTSQDDARGVDEPLDDITQVDPTLYIKFTEVDSDTDRDALTSQMLSMRDMLANSDLIVFHNVSLPPSDQVNWINQEQLPVNSDCGVRLLNSELKSRSQSSLTLLLRVQQVQIDICDERDIAKRYINLLYRGKNVKVTSVSRVAMSGIDTSGVNDDEPPLRFVGDVITLQAVIAIA
ncbi:hypothetical protein MIR68_009190 [Amoeboaphelidium protococcarum]|nr:hypothetical protein MIR68_009190 [Amoeboaphelidium protococcarum]